MKNWFRSRKLSTKFLLVTVPAILISALLFALAITQLEYRTLLHLNETDAIERGQRDAYLLSYPVWNLEDETIQSILDSLANDPKVRCIRLRDMVGYDRDLVDGQCNAEGNLRQVLTPIQFAGHADRPTIGTLEHVIDVSVKSSQLYNAISPLLTMVVILMLVLTLCVLVAFRWIILTPLDRVAQSIRHYRESGERVAVDWGTRDELGEFIAEYNQGLERQRQSESELRGAMERTEQALTDLKAAQRSLVQSEKLASLGSLVAGIAHEINTPVGNCLTVSSALEERVREFRRAQEEGNLKRSTLTDFVEGVVEASQILQRSLFAAAEQIQNFKQVAVDQTSSQRRRFDLKTTLEEVLSTLRPRIKHSHHHLKLEIPEGIALDSFPGPLGQVITNCFTNAVQHGFDGVDEGTIEITAELLDNARVRLSIRDNGRGIPPEHLKRVFDPFFTTRMGQGGTGLGMNLVYTIVTGLLGGTIGVTSELGKGTQVLVEIPLAAPEERELQTELNHVRT